jgi:hypothetical protein
MQHVYHKNNFVREISYIGASAFWHLVANGPISVKEMIGRPAPLRRRLRLPQERFFCPYPASSSSSSGRSATVPLKKLMLYQPERLNVTSVSSTFCVQIWAICGGENRWSSLGFVSRGDAVGTKRRQMVRKLLVLTANK